MPLNGYGYLVGTVTSYRPQNGGNPHALLMVQPANLTHPAYRVAVNLESTQPGYPVGIQYQIINIDTNGTATAKALASSLRQAGATQSFLLASDNPDQPCLDFVRGGLIDPTQFETIQAGVDPFQSAFEMALAQDVDPDGKQMTGALIAVFGTGYPLNNATGMPVPTGFTGVDNIHMNQGAMHYVNGPDHYVENGPNQDGGLIVLTAQGAVGFFVKFQSQTVQTDANGNPEVTGIAQLDGTAPQVRQAIFAPQFAPQVRAVQPIQAAPAPGEAQAAVQGQGQGAGAAAQPAGVNPKGYVFADTDPLDSTQQFVDDDDGDTYKTPFVMSFGTGHTRGPVPTPRGYPTMQLTDVVGASPLGVTNGPNGQQIIFDMVGDSGAPSQEKQSGELAVTGLMSRNALTVQPAFLFHVGDVVYYYGEEPYYYSQFAEPFKAYPAPIFAIPGNHDGVVYNSSMTSLAAFQQAFCATSPSRWAGFGGILRSTMTQPGVYFTLDAPLVSIIGLYSNCGEFDGWLDVPQLLFLYHELTRLKALRAQEGRAVILAIHHCPRWFPGETKADPTSAAIDRTFAQAGFWPDAVVCGHAHLMQRIVRQINGRDIPYLVVGCGGYGVDPAQELAKNYMKTLTTTGTRLGCFIPEPGYARVTVTKPTNGTAPTLQFEYMSTKQPDGRPADVCVVDLSKNTLV